MGAANANVRTTQRSTLLADLHHWLWCGLTGELAVRKTLGSAFHSTFPQVSFVLVLQRGFLARARLQQIEVSSP